MVCVCICSKYTLQHVYSTRSTAFPPSFFCCLTFYSSRTVYPVALFIAFWPIVSCRRGWSEMDRGFCPSSSSFFFGLRGKPRERERETNFLASEAILQRAIREVFLGERERRQSKLVSEVGAVLLLLSRSERRLRLGNWRWN